MGPSLAAAPEAPQGGLALQARVKAQASPRVVLALLGQAGETNARRATSGVHLTRALSCAVMLRSLALAAAFVGLAACQRVTAEDYQRDPKPPRPPDPSTTDDGLPPGVTTTGESGDGELDAGETVEPDDGFSPGDDGASGGTCPKVDLLFVIDNSSSMAKEQENLAQSIEGFVDGITSTLPEGTDLHLGVVTTDAYELNASGCNDIGDLVTQTGEGVCGDWGERRFMTSDDDLAAGFACAARVGIEGSNDEHPIEAALRALSPENAAPGACNEGFSRNDALLILVIISDEDDAPALEPGYTGSPGEPLEWAAQLVAARGGYQGNIVVLGILAVSPPNLCEGVMPQPSERIAEFTRSFTYQGIADVCAPDYAPLFDNALGTVYSACGDFNPPG